FPTVAISRRVAETIPGARLAVIAGGGHFPNRTHRTEVQAEIARFLAEIGVYHSRWPPGGCPRCGPRAAPPKEASMRRGWLTLLTLAVVIALAGAPAAQHAAIQVGLAAAVSGGSAASGEAIKRGLQIAIDEVNGK